MKRKINLMNNPFLKLFSLILAIILWAGVLIVSDGEGKKDFVKEVTLLNTNVVEERGCLYRVEDDTDTVKITVRARKSVLAELKESDFVVTADMEKNLKYGSMIAIDVECKNHYIEVERDVSLSHNNVVISLEEEKTAQFNINVTATEPSKDMYLESATAERSSLKITGPASIVERIEKVTAVVDIAGLTESTVKNCKLKLMDAEGYRIDDTFLDYVGKEDGINVKVSLLNTKTVPLKFDYTGTPAEKYKIKNISWKPETVVIAAKDDTLVNISEIEIPAEAVNVEGIAKELQVVIDLNDYLPDDIKLKDPDMASVLVSVEVENVKAEAEMSEEEPETESEN